jgi:subtilisin family serine protease
MPGTYEARFLANDDFVLLATSPAINIAMIPPTVTTSVTTVAPGAAFTVNVSNGPANSTDWVALASTTAPDTSYLAWNYLSGSKAPPVPGLTGAALTFVAPMTPGAYNLRLFANDGLTKLATSNFITVEAPAALTSLRETLGLPSVAPTTEFSSVGVAIIDSGIAPNADFSGRITGFYDFTNNRGGAAVAPYDDYGHGTHIAGLIGGSGVQSNNEIQGVAPGVRLVGLKVLDGAGAGNTSDVIAALQFVTANKAQLNVQIVNMSLGHPIYANAANDPLVQAVQQATAAGLIVVTSAGNYGQNPVSAETGYAGVTSPCNAPSAICVGAAKTENTVQRSDDTVAPYSSRGPSWYDGYAKPRHTGAWP